MSYNIHTSSSSASTATLQKAYIAFFGRPADPLVSAASIYFPAYSTVSAYAAGIFDDPHPGEGYLSLVGVVN